MSDLEYLKKNYDRYRWFLTSSKKLVIGGKNEEQNERLVKMIMKMSKEFIMMHTSEPGSPFTVILESINKVTEKDLEEAAIFTACFSRQWKLENKKTEVHIFTSFQVEKGKNMKVGTFGILGKPEKKVVRLKLYLTKQRKKLRAVPFETGEIRLVPGKMKKDEVAKILSEKLKVGVNVVVQALPSGGFEIEE